MKYKLLAVVIGALIVLSAVMASRGNAQLQVVAHCKNGDIMIPWKVEPFLPAIQAGFRPEAVIPIPPDCER